MVVEGSYNSSKCVMYTQVKGVPHHMCTYPRIYAYILRRGVKLGYTSHTKPAFFFVSQITPVPEYMFTSNNSQAWRCARPWHCVEGCGGDDGSGGNAMLVMAVVVMRGRMPWRVVVMSGW